MSTHQDYDIGTAEMLLIQQNSAYECYI